MLKKFVALAFVAALAVGSSVAYAVTLAEITADVDATKTVDLDGTNIIIEDITIGKNVVVRVPAGVTEENANGASVTISKDGSGLSVLADETTGGASLGLTQNATPAGGNLILSNGAVRIMSDAQTTNTKKAELNIGGGLTMTGGTIALGNYAANGGAQNAIADSVLKVVGTAKLSGGILTVAQLNTTATGRARAEAGHFELSGNHISNLDIGGVMEAKDTTYTGYGVDMSGNAHVNLLNTGGRIQLANDAGAAGASGMNIAGNATLTVGDLTTYNQAGAAIITAGKADHTFALGKDAILEITGGDLTLVTFDTSTLAGTVVFGSGASALLTDETSSAQLNALATAVKTTDTTDIQFTGKLMQSMNKTANGAGDLANAVLLIGAATTSDYGTVADKSIQTLVGAYTLAVGNGTTLGNDAGELYVTNVANAVDFSALDNVPANHTAAINNFAANAVALGYGNYLSNGVIANAFGVAANESGVATDLNNPATDNLADAYRIRYKNDDPKEASAGARYNYEFFKNLTNGYGSNYTYANEWADDGTITGYKNFTIDPATMEIYHAANVGKVNAAARDVSAGMLDAVDGRFLQLRRQQEWLTSAANSDYAYASRALACDYTNRIWAAGLGHWQDGDSRDGFKGYDYDGYGMMVGYDHLFGPLAIGASFGFEKGDFEDDAQRSNDSDIDSYSFNLYALYTHASGFFGSLAGGYTLSDADMSYRNGGGSWKEDYDTDTWYIEGKLGYDWKPANGFRISPSIGLGYISSESDGHRLYNKTINNWTARYDDQKTDTAYLPIDLEIAYDWCVGNGGTFSASVNGGYTYNFDDDEIDGTVFYNSVGITNGFVNSSAMAASYGHHTWNVGAGLKYSGAKWEVGAKYDYFHRADTDAHRVYGYVGFKF